MVEVNLNIKTPDGTKQVPLTGDHISFGRTDVSNIVIKDPGLSRLHASVYRDGDRVWVVDEGSTNGTFVNGNPVPAVGTPLADGDEISIGEDTFIAVRIGAAKSESADRTAGAGENKIRKFAPIAASFALIAAFLIMGGILVSRLLESRVDHRTARTDHAKITEENTEKVTPDTGSSNNPEENSPPIDTAPIESNTEPLIEHPGKLYRQMSDQEKLEFIDHEAQHISMMMGNRQYAFNDEVLVYIKKYVDGYASRADSSSDRLWGEGLRSLYGRAARFAPYIIRSFNARGVPPVVGLYIAMIETEYHECLESPVGAKGLFQFMPETARGYGVDPADRCDVSKMAPAAAKYMSDRIAEFGPDAMSVALAIAGYNRSPDSVRRDLHDVLNSENKERSFWTLVSNSTKLDRPFQNENIKYVPKFFPALHFLFLNFSPQRTERAQR